MKRDIGAYEEKGIGDAYKVGAMITMSRKPASRWEGKEDQALPIIPRRDTDYLAIINTLGFHDF